MVVERDIIDLWKQAEARGEDVYLATVVFVQGSSYRKPGARMLVTSSGLRAGTISGGCLEAEVAKKISWLTSNGPSIQEYKSSFDDDAEGVSYGLGCGGTIWVLMEPGHEARKTLGAMENALSRRAMSALVVSIASNRPGLRAVFNLDGMEPVVMDAAESMAEEVSVAARRSKAGRQPVYLHRDEPTLLPSYIVMPVLPPLRLHVFGAGDDAIPLVEFAIALGWEVTVWDGRSHLLRPLQFPAASLQLITYMGTPDHDSDVQVNCDLSDVGSDDFAVILTHSYAQDGALLQALVPQKLAYLGILGPLHRTRRLLSERVHILGETEESILARLHAPVGLDIGSNHPTVIALSIVAEMQAVLAGKEPRRVHR